MSAPGICDWVLLGVCVGSAAFNTVFAIAATRRLKRLRRVLAWRQRRLEKQACFEITCDQAGVLSDRSPSMDRGSAA